MSVQKRIRSGKTRWVGRYRDPTGKERSRTFNTKREATAWVAERERELRRGEWVNPDETAITVEQAVADYMAGISRQNTWNTYDQLRKNLGDLTHMPIGAVRVAHVEKWLQHLRDGRPWHQDKAPLSGNSVRNMRARLCTVFNYLVRQQILRINPVHTARAGVATGRRVDPRSVPTAGQVRELIRVLNEGAVVKDPTGLPPHLCKGLAPSPGLALMVELAAVTGMRLGELAGLRARDLDVEQNVIRVSSQAGRGGEVLPLKTKQSERNILIEEEMMGRLRQWVGAHPTPGEWVFPSAHGGAYSIGVLTNKLARARALSGLPDYMTWHSLRHFHATTLLSAGVPVKTVQARLGHASAAMTLDVYAHAVPDDDARAVAVIAGALRAAGPARDGGSGLRAV